MTDRILSRSSFSHIVDVPIERIDIADWLFNLLEVEYQRCCPPDRIAAGATSTDNGRRMSINVEMIAMIQHYIGEITEPHLCRMVSVERWSCRPPRPFANRATQIAIRGHFSGFLRRYSVLLIRYSQKGLSKLVGQLIDLGSHPDGTLMNAGQLYCATVDVIDLIGPSAQLPRQGSWPGRPTR